MFEIKNRWDDSIVVFSSETATDLREAVLDAVDKKANLSYANLSYANLSYANLSYANLRSANLRSANLSDANLSDANLSYANLSYANLSYANLRSANLSDANLSYANLSDANLSDANLSYANLSYANLSYANLRSANLSDANLRSANLSDANLSYANLRSANLSYANLRSANLSDANLSDANLSAFKSDFFEVLLNAPGEIAGLRQKLIAGEIDGSCYEPKCGMACLVGTIAILRTGNCEFDSISDIELPGIKPDGGRPAEVWFFNIRPGCTPDKNAVAAITLGWLDEFEAKIASFAALATGGTAVDQ